jgi:hypothetical protein
MEYTVLYLHCYDRLFSIFWYTSGKSYQLTQEQIELLINLFKAIEVPYSTFIVELECVLDRLTEDRCPANSRVIFQLNNAEYSIYNFNSYLIKYKAADNIAKALNSKSIKAKAEIVSGVFNNSNKSTPVATAPKNKKPEYRQVSIFERVG